MYGWDFIPYSEDSPCVYLFLVENSESFTCTVSDGSELSSFYASNAEGFDGADHAQISSGEASITASISAN